MNEAFIELDKAFDGILDQLKHPERKYEKPEIFRNLHGEKTEYADYAKVVYTFVVRVADDKMSAAINVVSTADKIRRYTIQELNRAIRQKGIVHGIDSEALMKMVSKQTFNRDVVFARGTPPVDGIDGAVEHLINMEEKTDVKAGTAICRITPPTAGTTGYDIFGHALPAHNGASISIPIGENTNFDKTTNILSATSGGKLTFKDGVYRVSDEYVINGNVSVDTGRIEFPGNVVIKGNVTDGAIIIAGKSVAVTGKVKGAIIVAKNNLSIDLSVKDSRITTEKGNMQLTSCYTSVINCGGNIELASLYNCKTKCIGNMDCTVNQGSINGGETVCVGKLICTTIGSRLHESTDVIVGDCTEFITERIMLIRSLNRIENDIEKINHRIGVIEGQRDTLGFISREDEDFLIAALRIRDQKEAEKLPIQEKISDIEKIINRAADSNLKVQRSMHANVHLKIKEHRREIDTEYGKITAYANDYGIVLS